MLTSRGSYMSHLRGIYGTFDHHYINVREEFDHYKYIISFNSEKKVKIKGSVGSKKGGLIGMV